MIKKFIRRIFSSHAATDANDSNTSPTILTSKQHRIDPKLVSNNAIFITQTLQQAGYQAYIVGGAVRDLLLGIKPKDFDIATNATPEQVKRLFRRAFIIGRRFQIVHVMFGQDLLEITTFRGPSSNDAPKDEHGRVLRDNTFGKQHEDAVRRDFTINAMYYNPANQQVLDYYQGVADIRKKILRIIGEPEQRYREDPVRMLRAVRLAAKLQFSIEPATSAPIARLASLIDNVPSARVFDEVLKLLQSGHAGACIKSLCKEGLHHGILPSLEHISADSIDEKFIHLALTATDERIKLGKPVSASFLFATLLWHQVRKAWEEQQKLDEPAIPALHTATTNVLDTQAEKLAIQRKISTDIREIWTMQPRFLRRTGKSPYKVLEHPRLRAGYDFLLLRCESGEIDQEIGQWWTEFMSADEEQRKILLSPRALTPSATQATKKPNKTRSRPRKKIDKAAPPTQ